MAIVAAVDRDPGIGAVIGTAAELATGLDEDLTVVHVVTETDDRETARAEVEEAIESELGDVEGATLRIVERKSMRGEPSGRTASTILDIADDTNARYIVVGSRKRTPVGKVMLGSVAQLVLVNSEVPVVTVEQAA